MLMIASELELGNLFEIEDINVFVSLGVRFSLSGLIRLITIEITNSNNVVENEPFAKVITEKI